MNARWKVTDLVIVNWWTKNAPASHILYHRTLVEQMKTLNVQQKNAPCLVARLANAKTSRGIAPVWKTLDQVTKIHVAPI